MFVNIHIQLGSLDRSDFERQLLQIYGSKECQLNHVRCSMYDYAKDKCVNFPEGRCLIRRVKRSQSALYVSQKYASDIYMLYHYVMGDVTETILCSEVLSKTRTLSGLDGDGDADTTLNSNTTNKTDRGAPINFDLADIVTSIIEIKELINEKVSALSSRIDKMEKNKDKEIENLKFKLSEKEEQNKMLEAQLNTHLINEQRIVSENKILKSDCKELETKLC